MWLFIAGGESVGKSSIVNGFVLDSPRGGCDDGDACGKSRRRKIELGATALECGIVEVSPDRTLERCLNDQGGEVEPGDVVLVLVVDVSNRGSMGHVISRHGEALKCGIEENKICILGNKHDSGARELSVDEGKALAKRLGARYFEVHATSSMPVQAALLSMILQLAPSTNQGLTGNEPIESAILALLNKQRLLDCACSNEYGAPQGGGGQTHPMTILVDMDGVLCDFDGMVNEEYARKYPEEPLLDLEHQRKCFYMRQNYKNEFGEEAAKRVKDITETEGFFERLAPFPGCIAALKEMDQLEGVHVAICTAPLTFFQFVLREKFSWIERHLGPEWVSRIVIAKDKTVVRGKVLIDDRPHIDGSSPSPTWEHILFDQPYNRDVPFKRRITSWETDEWRQLIQSLKRQAPCGEA